MNLYKVSARGHSELSFLLAYHTICCKSIMLAASKVQHLHPTGMDSFVPSDKISTFIAVSTKCIVFVLYVINCSKPTYFS